jgi:hypothetical protein
VVGHNFRTCPQPENPTRNKWPNNTKKKKTKLKKKSKDNGGYPAIATNSKSYINAISLQIVRLCDKILTILVYYIGIYPKVWSNMEFQLLHRHPKQDKEVVDLWAQGREAHQY